MDILKIVQTVGSQRALATALGVKPQVVQYWVSKNRVPISKARDVIRYCDDHDIPVDRLELVGLHDD